MPEASKQASKQAFPPARMHTPQGAPSSSPSRSIAAAACCAHGQCHPAVSGHQQSAKHPGACGWACSMQG
eukprot:366348-Chlamydomonas_euryale.AAC.7